MTEFTPITPIPDPIDLTPERYVKGDQAEVISKDNSRNAKLQAYLNGLQASLGSINTMGEELQIALNNVTNLLGAEISEFNADVARLRSDLTTLSTDLGIAETTAAAVIDIAEQLEGLRMQQLNEMPFHGRFITMADEDDWWKTGGNTAAFDGSALDVCGIQGYNGFNTTPVEGGRHMYNSNTYSGSSGDSDDAVAQAFITEMMAQIGTTPSAGNRYSPEFAIARFEAGTGTASTSDGDHHRQLNVINMHRNYSIQGRFCFAYWVQPVAESLKIYKYNPSGTRAVWVNGVAETDGLALELDAGQVYHVCHRVDFSNSRPFYSSTAFHWLMKASAHINIALPVLLPGSQRIPPHVLPWRSRNPV